MPRNERKKVDHAERFRRCEQQAAVYPYRIQRFNQGMHWRVDVGPCLVDFWPHSGKYKLPTATGPADAWANDLEDLIEQLREADL